MTDLSYLLSKIRDVYKKFSQVVLLVVSLLKISNLSLELKNGDEMMENNTILNTFILNPNQAGLFGQSTGRRGVESAHGTF